MIYKPRAEQVELIATLLQELPDSARVKAFAGSQIQNFDDGEMGSFEVAIDRKEIHYPYSEAKYVDSDGMGVLITLFIDENKFVKSVDFWKYDFSKLLKFPKSDELSEIEMRIQ